MNKSVKPRWYSGQDIVAMLGIENFEIFDLMKNGLQAYTNTGKKVINSDPLPREKRNSLEEVEANQRAKHNASLFSGRPLGLDDQIKQKAKWIYDAQSLEILNPPKDCELMSFTLPNDNEKASLAISRALFFQFKSADVVKSMNEYKQSHPLLSEETQNETVEHQKQPEQDFNEEANEIKDFEDHIRSLQIAYVSDAEISIKGSTTKTKTYSHDKLGFNREDTKEWCTLIQILQSPDHFYHVGMSHGTESTRNKEYDAKRTILIVISRKLVSFLNDAYALRLPEKFQIFEIIKKEKPGTYGPKFTVPNLSTKFADYDGCKRETLIPLIEKLSSKLVILRKRGDEQSETDLIKITHKLEEAIGVALEKKWLGKNQAASYLNPSTED